jgi:transcriptional regulator with XRE-family HTH domain
MPSPPAPPPAGAMTTSDVKGPPKYARVAAAVRGQIADGTLRPGQPAPSGAALSRVTGFSTLTCRRALRMLIADGVLVPGPSRNARPRVAGGPQPPAERDLAAAVRGLSAGLAARRRAAGLTQPDLAGLTGVSVTTVGHAETGRVWQSRRFWERADSVLGAGGDLLRLHDTYREAAANDGAGQASGPDERDRWGGVDGRDGRDGRPDGLYGPRPGVAPLCGPAGAGRPDLEQAGPGAAAPGAAVPACVTIMWGDGTITTVRPPGAGTTARPTGAVTPVPPATKGTPGAGPGR